MIRVSYSVSIMWQLRKSWWNIRGGFFWDAFMGICRPPAGAEADRQGEQKQRPRKVPRFLSALAIENSLRCLEWTWTLNNIEIYRHPMVSLEKKTATEGFSICFPYIYNNVLICTRGYHRSCEEFKKYPVWYLCSLGIYWIQQPIFGIIANDCRHSKGNFTIGYTFARDEY